MSDSEGDIDDELLELAGATEKKRKKRQAPSSTKQSKRRKADVSIETDSDDEVESEEDDSNPYPLEGKYIDEGDRERLMQMSEIERENILAQRLDEMQRIQDKRNLDLMLKAQNSRSGESDSVSKAAKRQHAVRGATKEKSRKLDELKAKRRAKDDKKRTKTNSPRRDRSSSPMDMEISDDEEEDGQISKYEEEEDKDRKRFASTSKPNAEPGTLEDLDKCRLTRDMLAKYCMAPWFEDYVRGSWVRYLIGQENGEPVYRICEIQNLAADLVKPYKVNDKMVNQALELRHGKSIRSFLMDKVSNSKFHPKEFERVVRACATEDVKFPSKDQLEKKSAQLLKLISQPMTENDITAMLARKNLLQANNQSGANMTVLKSRLTQERTLAIRRQEWDEVAEIDKKLADLTASLAAAASGGAGATAREEDDISDMLAKVNERNRKSNMEAVRKAELLEAERKRRERKLAASGTATPQHDPSARLKTVPRLFNSATSRPGTPNPSGGTPLLHAQLDATRSVSPLPPSALSGKASPDKSKKTFESAILDAVEVDLGDF